MRINRLLHRLGTQMNHALHVAVFDWKGTWHARIDRCFPAPRSKVVRRVRLASWSLGASAGMDEADAVRLAAERLLEVEARLRHVPAGGGFGAPGGATGAAVGVSTLNLDLKE